MRRRPHALRCIMVILIAITMYFPSSLFGFDNTAPQVASLDPKTIVIAKEWASEIRVYLIKVENNKMVLKDSYSIDYMTLKTRHTGSINKHENNGPLETSPIIEKTK